MNEVSRTPARNIGWGLFSDDFDRLFDGFLRPARTGGEEQGKALIPPTDVIEHDNEYLVRAELPGVRKEDIDITVQDGVLTINAESKSAVEERQGGRLIRQERRYGKYVRSMRLGAQIDEGKVKANYRDGVLELRLPKAEEVKPKKISVDVG